MVILQNEVFTFVCLAFSIQNEIFFFFFWHILYFPVLVSKKWHKSPHSCKNIFGKILCKIVGSSIQWRFLRLSQFIRFKNLTTVVAVPQQKWQHLNSLSITWLFARRRLGITTSKCEHYDEENCLDTSSHWTRTLSGHQSWIRHTCVWNFTLNFLVENSMLCNKHWNTKQS